MDGKGYIVDAKGYRVNAKDYNVDAKGYRGDAKGYRLDGKTVNHWLQVKTDTQHRLQTANRGAQYVKGVHGTPKDHQLPC
eukprot:5099238-Pyramimonas_sp.AAC.1